jgi:transcription antitermination factor NusG
MKTNRVANTIKVTDQQKLTDQLSQIEYALKAGAELKPQNNIQTGQLCRVKTGPLKHLEGTVISTKSQTKLILEVEMLGQGASVEVDKDIIEIIDNI